MSEGVARYGVGAIPPPTILSSNHRRPSPLASFGRAGGPSGKRRAGGGFKSRASHSRGRVTSEVQRFKLGASLGDESRPHTRKEHISAAGRLLSGQAHDELDRNACRDAAKASPSPPPSRSIAAVFVPETRYAQRADAYHLPFSSSQTRLRPAHFGSRLGWGGRVGSRALCAWKCAWR